MAEPTFLFGVGAQKAGTTWLYRYLRDHPEVHVRDTKELHYFDALWTGEGKAFELNRRQMLEHKLGRLAFRRENGMRVPPKLTATIARLKGLVAMYDRPEGDHGAYRDVLMEGHGDARCVADITPSYSLLTAANFQEMARAFAPAKFLFILRDPVQRMWSQIRMRCAADERRKRPQSTPQDVIDGLLRGKGHGVWSRSRMDVTLGELEALPKDTCKVMFYETMFRDSQMVELCDFLGIRFIPGSYAQRVNSGEALEMTAEQHATLRWLNAPIYRAIYDAMGDAIPASWDMTALTATRPAFLSGSEINEEILQGRMT